MHTFAFLIAAFGHLGAPTDAGPAPPVEREEDWPVGSAMQVGLAYNKRSEALEIEAQSLGDELLAQLAEGAEQPDSRVVEALAAEQVEWIRYRNASCELVGASTRAGGVWPSTCGAECRLVLTERRLAGFKACVSAMREQIQADRQLSIAACLGMQEVLHPE